MSSTRLTSIQHFVDRALQQADQVGLTQSPDPQMPTAMRNGEANADGWIPWKAIPSTVSDADIRELESQVHVQFPHLYVAFLQYKHFYELLPYKEIRFFPHVLGQWKQELLAIYSDGWDPDELIGKGYIPFATYSDWGVVCFNTTKPVAKHEDCEIVMIDHDQLSVLAATVLYPSFAIMIEDLIAELQVSKWGST